jgi:hypothetical protein
MSATVTLLILVALCLLVYFLPAIVAKEREHPNATAITVLNLILGWTLLGWVAALVWALTVSRVAPKIAQSDVARCLCPACGESISIHAQVCRFCNHQLASDWAEPPLLLRRRASPFKRTIPQ